jgi:hypothetical protein
VRHVTLRGVGQRWATVDLAGLVAGLVPSAEN